MKEEEGGGGRPQPVRAKKLRLQTRVYGQLLAWATKSAGKLLNFQVVGQEHVIESIRQGRPIIFAGWHGHNFLTILSYYGHIRHLLKATIMVPESANGLVMDHFGKRVNLNVIKVSAELGPSQWARATVSMIKLIRSGYCALLSPDGPDGPAYEVKPGIAVIGQQTKAVVIPASAASRRGIKLRSRWDEHLLPLPFSRTLVYFGTPIDTSPEGEPAPTVEELQERIKQALIEGERQAKLLCRGSAAAKEAAR